jgi:hypothetical protein
MIRTLPTKIAVIKMIVVETLVEIRRKILTDQNKEEF